MSLWGEYLHRTRSEWIGRRVVYDSGVYTVVDVDHNGALLIDKPARFTDTTAVAPYMVQEI